MFCVAIWSICAVAGCSFFRLGLLWSSSFVILLSALCLFFFFFNDTATTEIYTLSLHDALPICAGARVGNDVDPEARLLHRVDGETHPVDGDRALGREVTRERRRYADAEAHGTRIAAHLQNLRNTVDVSGHQVSAERISGPQRRLEIHRRTGPQFTEGGERERLARYVGGEAARLHRNRGQTATLHADTVADAHPRQLEVLGRDHQAHIAATRFPRLHRADVLDDSGEHSSSRGRSFSHSPRARARRGVAAAAAGHHPAAGCR